MLLQKAATRARLTADFWRHYIGSFANARLNAKYYDELFANVANFCIFLGHPRSGSTLVGSLLDAHPEAVIATELDALGFAKLGVDRRRLYLSSLKRSEEFANRHDYTWEGYAFHVPNQWQGKATTIRVIGDKKAGLSAERLRRNPSLLRKLQDVVEDPLKIIHVIRNPYDNITTFWRRGRYRTLKMPIDKTIENYFGKYAAVMRARDDLGTENVLTLHHEEVLADVPGQLSRLCRHVGLEANALYLQDCAGVVNVEPQAVRHSVAWSQENIDWVRREIERHPSLMHYTFDR